MAGTKGRSGGHNRKSALLHALHGTFRPARHGRRPTASNPEDEAAAAKYFGDREPAPAVLPGSAVSRADRRRVLAGLTAGGRRLAAALLDARDGWDPSTLETLRHYVRSCERLEVLYAITPSINVQSHGNAIQRELRANIALAKALGVPPTREVTNTM